MDIQFSGAIDFSPIMDQMAQTRPLYGQKKPAASPPPNPLQKFNEDILKPMEPAVQEDMSFSPSSQIIDIMA
ncbi:MAG: hypothetical protein HY343_10425 [Lentisphaerae bacterium]|nr:hypothetical protein [Lentisphaerota bacterium]